MTISLYQQRIDGERERVALKQQQERAHSVAAIFAALEGVRHALSQPGGVSVQDCIEARSSLDHAAKHLDDIEVRLPANRDRRMPV